MSSRSWADVIQYAAGATVQILMFSILACKVKMNAPNCHTYLEIIYTRYGVLTHGVFIFFALLTNVLVGSQLLLGGSAVVTSLTGMNVYAAIFLIPLGVCVYVVLGGLRATFLCEIPAFIPYRRIVASNSYSTRRFCGGFLEQIMKSTVSKIQHYRSRLMLVR